ncbi:MAG: ParA family protein [Eubacteriales bacterium]|jgi:chromosome partitioning protein|nr:ParA family protein [Eubacteriales bacterium]MDD3095062.1 ParA family protein [Candidatus Neomarinimicrobiota bacterium]MDD3966944.1 ParA family protein [Candidatus Neomarinimicrobiota bacterium]
MKIIALVNNKGGVGKTTSAVNLAAGLVAAGRRVLLADLDAQGSASLSLGLTRADLSPGSAEVILDGHPIREAIRPTSVKGLDILPGSMALASADLVLSAVAGREVVLKDALTPIRGDYDFTVLDCPPSLGLLTVNALTAADFFIVPVTPDYLSLEGLVNLLDAVERIKKGIGKAAGLLGILLTLADYRLNVTEEIGQMIRGYYGRLVFKAEIRGNVRLKEAPSFGKTIFDYDNGSAGAEAYRQLTKEVLKRINK